MKAIFQFGILSLLAVAAVQAGPISSCSPNQQQLVTCNLYETDALGNPTETPPPVFIGNIVGLGFVVFLEPGINPAITANDNNLANWSDVVDFTFSNGKYYVQLFSDPFTAQFGNTVKNAGAAFLSEAANGPTTFIGGSGNTYNIYSSAVPEPSTLPLAGIALLGAVCLTLRKRAVS